MKVENNLRAALPTDPTERKAIPIVSGVLDYFPAALAEVAKVSKAGNDQHNPGQPLHWARGKSSDHADTIVRHLVDRGTIDKDGQRHSAKVAWRALALLQEELEAEGAALGRGSRIAEEKPAQVTKTRVLKAGFIVPDCPMSSCDVHWRDALPGEVVEDGRSVSWMVPS